MSKAKSYDPRRGINIKVHETLRARADMCAKLEGLGTPEFVRAAIAAHCERSERLHAQRARAAKAVGANIATRDG